MSGDNMKHKANEEGLGEVVEAVKKEGGGSQGGGNVIQGCDTGGTYFWLGDLDTFGNYGEEGGNRTHWFYEADHGEAGAAEGIKEVGDSQGIISAESVGNSVGDEAHM